MTRQHVVILGAGSAGSAAARALAGRADLAVTVVARTAEIPYVRMLVKGVAFEGVSPEGIRLALPEAGLVADTVEEVDAGRGHVRLSSGRRLGYDALVVATGSAPRILEAEGADVAYATGTATSLHSLEDALRVREVVGGRGRPAHVAIYGGGLIAAETASALRSAGHEVTLVARSAIPGRAAFGGPVAASVAADHARHVTARLGRRVVGVEPEGRSILMRLDDDERVAADLLVVALGTTPAAPTPWTAGVTVDAMLRADAERVYAAGGVAHHRDEHLGAWRIDHWDDSAAQGAHAAATLLHDLRGEPSPGPYRPRSGFVSVLYGTPVAGLGLTSHPELEVIEGGDLVVAHVRGGALVGVSGRVAVPSVYELARDLHEPWAGIPPRDQIPLPGIPLHRAPTPREGRSTLMSTDNGHHHVDIGSTCSSHAAVPDTAAPDDIATCPVMAGSPVVKSVAEAQGLFRDFEGERYWFCCAGCGPAFDADPRRYASAA